MRSRKGFWIVAFAIVLIITGIWLRSGGMIAVSIPLIVYIAVSSLLARYTEFEVEATRSLADTRIMAGDDIEVALKIKNTGPPIALLEVEDMLPEFTELADGSRASGGSNTSGSNVVMLTLARDEEFVLNYSLKCPFRGRYRCERVRFVCRDHLGLYSQSVEIKLRSEFSVVSEIEPSRGLKIAPRKTRNWIGMIKARRIGQGTEFFGMREYVSGDEMRRINWKASAKRDELMTNEFESECSGDVTIMLDARTETNVGSLDNNTVEHSVRAASTIAAHILKDKNRVGLIVLRDIIDEVYPAFGKRQFYKISEKLMDVRSGGSLPFDDARWMVTSYFPLESMIIVISPLMDFKIIESIADLCARGYDVVVVAPSPIEVEAQVLKESQELQLAMRLQEVERANLISELRKYARIVDWDTADPLATAMKGVERLKARH